MEYRRLGSSGVKVSQICLGAMMFGDRTTKSVAARIVAAAIDGGVNFIDTADSYAKGQSERMVGQLIRKQRDRWVLATKVQNAMIAGDPNAGGLGRKWMTYEIDASLGRLNTDYVDIYYLHRDDGDTPLEETVSTPGPDTRAGRNDRRMLEAEFRDGIAPARAAHQGARRTARDDRGPVRAQLGAQQPSGDISARGTAHRSAVARVSGRARSQV